MTAKRRIKHYSTISTNGNKWLTWALLTANHILLRAPKGSPSISRPKRPFQRRKAKWNVYVMKITFLAKFAEAASGKEEHLVRKRAAGGGGRLRAAAHSVRATSHICRCELVFPGMTSGEFGLGGQHLWLKSFHLLEVRLAQVPALINIIWRSNSHSSLGFGSAILRWWQCKTSCSVLWRGKQFRSWPKPSD